MASILPQLCPGCSFRNFGNAALITDMIAHFINYYSVLKYCIDDASFIFLPFIFIMRIHTFQPFQVVAINRKTRLLYNEIEWGNEALIDVYRM